MKSITDETGNFRRFANAALNSAITSTREDVERNRLENLHGKGNVWDTKELQRDFEVLYFMAPFVIVRKKDTNMLGTVLFQHQPRFYFAWAADSIMKEESADGTE